MMSRIVSHALLVSDYQKPWYKKWSSELKQDKNHLDGYAPFLVNFGKTR